MVQRHQQRQQQNNHPKRSHSRPHPRSGHCRRLTPCGTRVQHLLHLMSILFSCMCRAEQGRSFGCGPWGDSLHIDGHKYTSSGITRKMIKLHLPYLLVSSHLVHPNEDSPLTPTTSLILAASPALNLPFILTKKLSQAESASLSDSNSPTQSACIFCQKVGSEIVLWKAAEET